MHAGDCPCERGACARVVVCAAREGMRGLRWWRAILRGCSRYDTDKMLILEEHSFGALSPSERLRQCAAECQAPRALRNRRLHICASIFCCGAAIRRCCVPLSEHGCAEWCCVQQYGGALFLASGYSATLSNCSFSHNTALVFLRLFCLDTLSTPVDTELCTRSKVSHLADLWHWYVGNIANTSQLAQQMSLPVGPQSRPAISKARFFTRVEAGWGGGGNRGASCWQ